MADSQEHEANIKNIIEQDSLKWIFVGGKGGVGKTTVSIMLAMLLSKTRRSVLLISADPAHNLSDALSQKVQSTPGKVTGFENLYAMELDTNLSNRNDAQVDMSLQLFKNIISTVPGIEESISYAEALSAIKEMDFSVIVVDTPPTGQTLRLLALPKILEKNVSKMAEWRGTLEPMVTQMGLGLGLSTHLLEDAMSHRMDALLEAVKELNGEFRNPEETTFLCVCLADFLSLYETERLVQELSNLEMDVRNIVVNQLLPPETSSCGYCSARLAQQTKYLEQITDLYGDIHVVKLILQKEEVRGVQRLNEFSQNLVKDSA